MAPTIFDVLPWFLRPSRLGGPRSLALGLTLGFSLSLSLTGLALYARDAWKQSIRRKAPKRVVEVRSGEIVDGVEGLIGELGVGAARETPLTHCGNRQYTFGPDQGKCEFLNPFGSVKDRVSLRIIQEAEDEGLISPHTGSCIFEGTSGSTGISIAGIARSRGYKAHIVLPDDVAREKVQLLEALGAEVEKVRPVSIVDKRHYVNLARLRAAEFGKEFLSATTELAPSPPASPSLSSPHTTTVDEISTPPPQASLLVTSAPPPSSPLSNLFSDPPRGLFADQFENLSNLAAHEDGTAQEIWKQTSGVLDAFVSGAGTGGTIAGLGRYLKDVKPDVKIVLADPQGSGLFHKAGLIDSERDERC
ncbi:hypothetical protein P7C70_g6663, partial [Phenoliferia sp. Uapishka_3]